MDTRALLGSVATAALLLTSGCAGIFGIDDWEDPLQLATTSASSGTGGGPEIGGTSVGGGGEGGGGEGGDGGEGGAAGNVGQGGSGGAPATTATAGTAPCSVDPDNPHCHDCIKNGLETGIDCGGDSCAPCPGGVACDWNNDCASSQCLHGLCL